MIFQADIQNLQAEITNLEALIADRLSQIQQLQMGESVATNLIEQTTTALATLRPMGEGAIARLKTSLLNLFGDGDDPGNDPDGGSTPPSDGGGSDCGESVAPESYDPMEAAGEPEEVVTNLVSDTEQTIDDIGFTATPSLQPYAELARLSKHVAYFRRHDATPLTAYAGFSAKARAEAWGRWLVTFSIAQGFEVRSPKHLTNHKHELKLWGLTLAQVLALNESDLTRTPGTRTSERFPGAVKKEVQLPPSYTKPTHRLYVNGLEVLHRDEMTVRRAYNEAIALPDTQTARILSAYKVESEYYRDSIAAGLEPPTDWMAAQTTTPLLHTFSLKPRQVEQLSAIARMYSSLGFQLRNGLTGSSTPNWEICRQGKKLGELFYVTCTWELESNHPDLSMDGDDFIDQLRDWDCITEEEAIA